MPLSKERPFGLDHNLQTSSIQVVSGCLSCERLVEDLLEDRSNLRGILSLPRGGEVLGIVSVSLRKL